ncbi:hypothetical protein GCM10022251_74260 [Phytohabitans flavus]|uniref:Uncharacterized protein n=1 Tax=Phytohabitans flavus TaxID=1076124 RepID=A0A6F8XL08_9ACTN|nr:hypothetical protein [Phytohabitans flavus]BCB74504.1 hypothetical protein Pflav_009140 [Phytohabitans flavus]
MHPQRTRAELAATGFDLQWLNQTGGLFANAAYARPYGDLVGQLVLFAAMLLLVSLLAWIRRLTQPARQHRFLSADGGGRAGLGGAPAVFPSRREVAAR